MDIKPGPIVTVSSSAGVYQAKSVVITAGPWANKLLTHTDLQLPLEVFKLFVPHMQYCPYSCVNMQHTITLNVGFKRNIRIWTLNIHVK